MKATKNRGAFAHEHENNPIIADSYSEQCYQPDIAIESSKNTFAADCDTSDEEVPSSYPLKPGSLSKAFFNS